MRHDPTPDDVAGRYAAAHAAHYAAGNLRQAIGLYEAILAEHNETPEAGYARSQIENIVRALVPRAVLFQAGVDLALAADRPSGRAGSVNACGRLWPRRVESARKTRAVTLVRRAGGGLPRDCGHTDVSGRAAAEGDGKWDGCPGRRSRAGQTGLVQSRARF